MLQMVRGIGSVRLQKLTDYFGGAEAAWNAAQEELRGCGCLDRASCGSLIAARAKMPSAEALARDWEARRIGLCAQSDVQYPESLKQIYDPPFLLFYRGTFSAAKRRIAIVGARKSSSYGQAVARKLSGDLAAAGIEIVSGAARGIDTAAHQGALETGRTIAVLGCGVDVSYPAENRRLLDEIAEKGLILSEYAPGVAPSAKFFPARNRIISGLSDGVVVVEAATKSGSLITAELALNEGRDVFAVPGSVFSDFSKGCHQLIRQGAKLVDKAEDILEEYEWQSAKKSGRAARDRTVLSEEEKLIYQCLSYEQPVTVDEIILKTRSDASSITFVLLQMQLRGLIAEHGPHCYVRAMREDVL